MLLYDEYCKTFLASIHRGFVSSNKYKRHIGFREIVLLIGISWPWVRSLYMVALVLSEKFGCIARGIAAKRRLKFSITERGRLFPLIDGIVCTPGPEN